MNKDMWQIDFIKIIVFHYKLSSRFKIVKRSIQKNELLFGY